MCGIAGKVWKDVSRPADRDAIKAMTDIQAHRGPDDAGHYCSGPLALGHRRLSILDLSPAGHQPMLSADGKHVIVFNGEIYNFVELRQTLEGQGCTFRSGSDTEVLLEAYRHWGPDCVKQLNGMWAFAIYDVAQRQLFLSRDRFGIKPLYYILRADCFAFASEIKGILAALPEERRVNQAFLHHFLPSGALDDGTETFFVNVISLPPAHCATYDLHAGSLRTWRYWDLDREAFRAQWAGQDPVEVLRELLQSAVALHMRSDVPVGTCLSGGLDSSTIVCLMSRLRRDPVHTFSGLYQDADCAEKEYADAVNRHTGAIPCPIYPEPRQNLLRDLMTITWHQDEPTAGPGLYTQFHVMRAACQHVKVILDGQGSDELFAGYVPYLTVRAHELLDRGGFANRVRAVALMAQMARHWGVKYLAGLPSRVVGPRVAQLAGHLNRLRRKPAAPAAQPPFFHPAMLERVRGCEIVRDRPVRLPGRLDNDLYWHVARESIPALLHYEDRNSMAFSIEARVPLLDYRIVEFALSLDTELKIKGSWTKWVLRQAAAPILPAKVTWRRSKLGYPTPFARWLRQEPHRSEARDVLFARSFQEREIVDRPTLQHYWDAHQAGAADCSWLLYRYLTLELWHQMYIDQWAPQPAVHPLASHSDRAAGLAA